MNIAFKPKTPYQQLLDAPANMTAEIIDGEIYLQAKPATPHQNAVGLLLADLVNPFQRGRGGPGGWWIINEPQFDTGDPDWRTLVPDIAGWRKARVPQAPEMYFTIAPDWVCEVLSPSTRLHDRETKMRVYLEEGVTHLWLIDPSRKLFEAYESRDGAWTLLQKLEGTGEIAAAPFAQTPIPLADLWPEAAQT